MQLIEQNLTKNNINNNDDDIQKIALTNETNLNYSIKPICNKKKCLNQTNFIENCNLKKKLSQWSLTQICSKTTNHSYPKCFNNNNNNINYIKNKKQLLINHYQFLLHSNYSQPHNLLEKAQQHYQTNGPGKNIRGSKEKILYLRERKALKTIGIVVLGN